VQTKVFRTIRYHSRCPPFRAMRISECKFFYRLCLAMRPKVPSYLWIFCSQENALLQALLYLQKPSLQFITSAARSGIGASIGVRPPNDSQTQISARNRYNLVGNACIPPYLKSHPCYMIWLSFAIPCVFQDFDNSAISDLKSTCRFVQHLNVFSHTHSLHTRNFSCTY
jgi:hypothetical protein